MKTILICLVLLLSACSTQTHIIDNKGRLYTVESKADGLVVFEQAGNKITVDNRGRPTLFESIITMMFMDTKLKNEVKED